MLISDLLKRQASNNKIAIKYANNSITFCDWHNRASVVGDLINSITTSNNIAIFLHNSINYALSYFSILYADKTIVPIDVNSKKTELLSILEYAEVSCIVSSEEYISTLKSFLSEYQYKIQILNINDSTVTAINQEKDYILCSDMNIQDKKSNKTAIMLHTSGTTSNPKRVMLTHDNLINNIESNISSLQLTKDDTVLIALPMYFGYCNTAQFLTHLYLGAKIIVLDKMFLPNLFFSVVQSERITNFTGVPSMLLMLLNYRYFKKYDYSSLKIICFGGGVMPTEKLKELIEKYPTIGFVHTYGQTECSPRLTALLPEDSLRKIGSVGRPIPNVEIKVVDENRDIIGYNEIGEIIAYGKNIMKGYYKNQKETDKILSDQGWIRTGDLGYWDEEGYLYLSGRKKNMIISGGINIYPEEIENVLLNHIDILEVCVVGEPHELLGEVPIAKIVLKPSCKISGAELLSFCDDNLTSYKVPKRFDICFELPKTYTGKIKRY